LTVYEPSDDTYLLLSSLPENLAGKSVLDVGCGNGLLSEAAANRKAHVLATDISVAATKATRERCEKLRAGSCDVIVADLLCELNKKAKFDLILFNPPYLPADAPNSSEWTGGRHGWELGIRFVHSALPHLKKEGSILLLLSSASGKGWMNAMPKTTSWKILKRKRLFFETLFVVSVRAVSESASMPQEQS